MSFATIEDYEAVYEEYADHDVLQAWLDDATALLTQLLGARLDPEDEVQAENLKSVCRSMVSRILKRGAPYGVTQVSLTESGFGQSMTYADATGDLFPKKWELARLGLGDQELLSISPEVDDVGA